MTPQPPQPQGPKGPEHGPASPDDAERTGAERRPSDEEWLDELNAGGGPESPEAPEASAERAAERPEDGEPSVVSDRLEGEQPEPGATVNVLRSSGDMDDDWQVVRYEKDADDNLVALVVKPGENGGESIVKNVPVDELKKWQRGEQPDAAATGGEEPKPADDDDTAERPVAGDDDDKEPPRRGWFGRVKDRISNAYYGAGAAATTGGGERGDRVRKASKYLPVGIAAVGSAGIMFGGLSLLDGGESSSFDFSGTDIDLDKHLSIDGADHTVSIDVTPEDAGLDGSGGDGGDTGGSGTGSGEEGSDTGGLSPDSSTATPAEQSGQQSLDHFQVEAGNGDSHEIQDYAKKHGIDIDGQKAYEIYEKLHNKFPDQDIINLLDHGGPDSYDHTLADGSTEQRISAPSENATFGSQEMQDLVDKELGLSSEEAAPSGPSDGGTSAPETATVSYDSDSDSATAAAAQGDTLEETTGKDVQKDDTSTFDDRNVSYTHEGPDISGGEKLVASGMAGAAGGMAAHYVMNRDKSGNNSGNGSTTGENDNNGNDKKNEKGESDLEKRVATLEQALLQQKEFYENQIRELTEVIKQLEDKLEQKTQENAEAEERRKTEEAAEKAKKKAKKQKRKTKEAKKKARKQKTRRKVTEATLNAERKAHSDVQLAEARARATEEMRVAAESAKTRADLLTKA